jgi:protein-S-isoprenylcysteine O-methyltransferase
MNPTSSSERASYESDWHSPGYTAQAQNLPFDPSLLPDGRRSLSSIAFQAFGLGFTLAGCLIATTYCVISRNPIWRLPAFFACLSIFHFLEFWTTAKFNMPAARASSFLLRNGKAYTIAHLLATIEIITSYWFPSYQVFLVGWLSITIGVVVVVLGQLLRSSAMAEAGTNFNHTPAKMKKEGHVLVTAGVYTYLRHPSYCAFFWWAIGTQILVGNKVSLLGFAFVLWNFFKRRIQGELVFVDRSLDCCANKCTAEEITLVQFFGMDYEEYRKRTITGIPFVQ